MKSYSNYTDLKIWSLPELFLPVGSTAREAADAICYAAAQEGLLLHSGDVIGLSPDIAGAVSGFEEQLQEALQQCAGVRPRVMIYGASRQAEPSALEQLCILVSQHSRNHSHVVVIQGAAL